jgi:hypothetical protein
VTLEDTLPAFETELAGAQGPHGRPDLAWVRYETIAAAALASAGAQANDPGDRLLYKVCANPSAVLTLAEDFERAAPRELDALVAQFAAKFGAAPRAIAIFAVTRAWTSVFRGERSGQPVLLFNARAPDLATPQARRGVFARELFRLLHASWVPDSPSLSPLSREVFRSGAASFAARQLAPQAPEPALLGVDERQLSKLHAREAVIAKELLAGLDSASSTEAARFFDLELADPLLPPGSGRFVSDRVYQRIAEAEGSLDAPLRMSAADFLRRARPALERLAEGR